MLLHPLQDLYKAATQTLILLPGISLFYLMNAHLKLIIALAVGLLSSRPAPPSGKGGIPGTRRAFTRPCLASLCLPSARLLLPDGKFLLFYNTDTLTDQRTGAITRYLPDGSLDASFFSRRADLGSPAASTPTGSWSSQPSQYCYGDGSGGESSGSGAGTEQVLRLNADGSIDPTFNISQVHPEAYVTARFITIPARVEEFWSPGLSTILPESAGKTSCDCSRGRDDRSQF